MMIHHGHGMIGFVLTFIAFVFALFACVVSLVIVMVILLYQYHHRRLEREEKITLVLSFHIYLFLFIFATLQMSMNIQTLVGDVYGNNFDSTWCILHGYFILVSGTTMYFTFIVQAVFRLCRIAYSNYRWLQSYSIFVISAPILFIGVNALIFPLLIWHDIIYLPNEHYCYIVLSNIRSTLWIMLFCYLMLVVFLLLIHIRITIFLRRQKTYLATAIKERQKRDLMIIQRIFVIVGVLFVLGLPGTIVTLMPFITGVSIFLDQRITLLAVEISLAVLSIAMILLTPQLEKLFFRRRQESQTTTMEDELPMETVANAQ